MYKVSETVLPIYINGQCPIIKTCSDVTLNLSSKDSSIGTLNVLHRSPVFCNISKVPIKGRKQRAMWSLITHLSLVVSCIKDKLKYFQLSYFFLQDDTEC